MRREHSMQNRYQERREVPGGAQPISATLHEKIVVRASRDPALRGR
jgi:hypothetical protein